MIDKYCWLACGRMLELLPIKIVAVRVRTCSHSNCCHACLCRSPLQLLSCVSCWSPRKVLSCVSCWSPRQLLPCVNKRVSTALVIIRVCACLFGNCCPVCVRVFPQELFSYVCAYVPMPIDASLCI